MRHMRTLRVSAVLAGLSAGACRDPGSGVSRPTTLPCSSPAFFVGGPYSFTATGDTQRVHVPGGHEIYLNASVAAGTRFTVTRADASRASLSIEPAGEGVTYRAPVQLTVNYAACVSPGDSRRFALYRSLPNGTLELVGSSSQNQRVTAVLDHFSIYIVGGN